MKKADKERVASATVTIERGSKHGQGVLVPGPFVLTATHVIRVTYTGGAVLGDHFYETIVVGQHRFKGELCAAEAFSDIAALEMPDYLLADDFAKFEQFCGRTTPVPVSLDELERGQSYEVHVYTHKHEWVKGTGQVYGYRPYRFITATFPKALESGASGSPIVDCDGRLLAVFSNNVDFHPLVRATLPVWVVERIRREQEP